MGAQNVLCSPTLQKYREGAKDLGFMEIYGSTTPLCREQPIVTQLL